MVQAKPRLRVSNQMRAVLHITLGVSLAQSIQACATAQDASTEITQIKPQSATVQTPRNETEGQIDQISPRDINTQRLRANQIATPSNVDSLTVDQLVKYNDRCRPDSSLPVPLGLDCSELKLRIEREMDTNDNIRDALITMDRLGRDDKRANLQSLRDGNPDDFESQAIAGGVLNPAPLEPAPDEDEKVEELLDINGIAAVIGTVVESQ